MALNKRRESDLDLFLFSYTSCSYRDSAIGHCLSDLVER